ncbi:MAG: O-antigen ligase family protein [Elusimicrobiota bacterium]|nr:O-antigen ligase family protein [Elusimicrobiota bacterium]
MQTPQSYSQFLQNNLTKILLYGFPIFYFMMAVSFYLVTYDSAQIKITILHVFGLFLIMNYLVLKIEQGADFAFLRKNFIFVLPILLFLLSGMFSFGISPFKDASLNEIVKRFIYCAIVFILISEFHSQKSISRIINWLIVAAYISTLYGLLQIVDYHFFPPNPNPGLDPFIWRQAFGYRILSTFGNPNFYGDFLITMGPIVLALFLFKRQPYLLILWLLIIANTFHTYSKGAWLATAGGNFAFVLLYVFVMLRHRISKKLIMSALGLILIILSVAGIGIYRQSVQRMDSLSFRIITWLATWDMINSHPIIGTGIGTFYVTYPAFRRPQIFYIEGKHNNESDHPENEYLEVWFDEGTVGFAIFLTILAFCLFAGIRNILFLNSKSNGIRDGPNAYLSYLQLGVTASLAAKMTHDATCVSLRFVSSGVMLWLLIGLTLTIGTICLNNEGEEIKFQLKKAFKTALIILSIGILGAFIKSVYGYFYPAEGITLKLILWELFGAILILGIVLLNGSFSEKIKKYVRLALQIAVIIAFCSLIWFFAKYFYADILHSRAITYSRAGQSDIAVITYEGVLKNNPTFPMARYFKSNVHFERWKAGDPAMAEYEFLKLWKMAPNYVQSKYLAGMMYARLFEENIALRNQYIQNKRPEADIARLNEYLTRLFNDAVRCFNESLAIDPIYPLTYYRLSSLYALIGELPTAERVLYAHLQYPDRLQEHPHNLWTENWRERVMPEYAETYFQLGNLYASNERMQAAVEAYQNALNIFPTHLFARKNLAAIFDKIGNKDEARQQWLEVQKIDPNDPDAQNYFSRPPETAKKRGR